MGKKGRGNKWPISKGRGGNGTYGEMREGKGEGNGGKMNGGKEPAYQ